MEAQTQRRRKLYILMTIVVVAVMVVAVAVIVGRYYFSIYDRVNSENIQAFIGDYGIWAPLVYAGIYVVTAPIPFATVVLSPLAGLLFGTFWGALLAIGVATISSLIPFTLARQLGRNWVESKLEGKKLDGIYQQSRGQGGLLFILMMRLVPVVPWEVQNYLAGVTQVAVPVYLIATALGTIPTSTALVLLGNSATDPNSRQFFVAVGLNGLFMGSTPFIASHLRRRRKAQEVGDKDTEKHLV